MDKIVLLSKLYEPGRKLLDGKIEIVERFTNQIEDAAEDLKTATVVLIGNQRFQEPEFALCPHLRILAKQGSGTDNINLVYATSKNIPVVTSPGANAQSVAEHVMMLILAASRNLIRYDKATRTGNYAIRSSCDEMSLYGKTIGLVGYGRIGKAVASYAKAFGMKVIVYDPYIKSEMVDDMGIEFVDIPENLYETADVVSIHVPLTNQTRNMIGAKEMAKMKQGVVIVNCSRGGIIDEKALYEALKSGHIHGAGLDVHEKEPTAPTDPLFSLDNVVVTPHSAALTKESAETMSVETAKGLLAILHGNKWNHIANPEIYNTK